LQKLSQLALLIQTPAPTDQALQLLLRSIISSIMKRLVHQGNLVQEQDQWCVADTVADDTDTRALRPLQEYSIVYRIAFGPRAGRKVPKGQVELKLKPPRRDGTTHHVMSPLEFMQRLAALVPRPRLHLIRFHGAQLLNHTECEVALEGSTAGVRRV
jgi:hypothetical protein